MRWNQIFSKNDDPADADSKVANRNHAATAIDPVGQGESAEESTAWRSALLDLEHAWSDLDLDKLWSIYRTDLNKNLKHAKDSTPSDELFSIEEQKIKRADILAFHERNFLSRMMEELPSNWWHRILTVNTREAFNSEDVRSRYVDLGQTKFFEKEHRQYIRKKEAIEECKPSCLFDNSERVSRLFPKMREVREKFSSLQQQQFKLFNDYIGRVSGLPFDEIDNQLSQMARDFEFLGRSREWFAEYEHMIHEINSSVADVDEGQNESIIRLLQNDFLIVMQSRFSNYWRLHELEIFCEKRNYHETRKEIEDFQTQIVNLKTNGMLISQQEQLLQEFIKSIESKLARDTEKTRSHQKKTMDNLLTQDHKARLIEWAHFKKHYSIVINAGNLHQLENNFNYSAAFNALRPILRQCAEWQHEFRIFRSMIKSKRSMDPRRINSDLELRDVQTFLNSIMLRIEAQIGTDVAYRSLEQELVRNKEFIVDLIITRKKLALEKQLRSSKSPEVINGIKQDFIEMMRAKRDAPADDDTINPPLQKRRKGRF